MIFRTVAISLRKFDWHSIIQDRALEILFDVPCTFLSPLTLLPDPVGTSIKIQPPFLAALLPPLSTLHRLSTTASRLLSSLAHSFLPFNIVFPRMGFTDRGKGCLTPSLRSSRVCLSLVSRQSVLYSSSRFHQHDEISCAPVRRCTLCTAPIQSSVLFIRAYLLHGSSHPPDLSTDSFEGMSDFAFQDTGNILADKQPKMKGFRRIKSHRGEEKTG